MRSRDGNTISRSSSPLRLFAVRLWTQRLAPPFRPAHALKHPPEFIKPVLARLSIFRTEFQPVQYSEHRIIAFGQMRNKYNGDLSSLVLAQSIHAEVRLVSDADLHCTQSFKGAFLRISAALDRLLDGDRVPAVSVRHYLRKLLSRRLR